MTTGLFLLLGVALLAAVSPSSAAEAVSTLEPITVVATGLSNMDAASVGDVGHDQLASLPLLRPAALLEAVPGLIVTQHSGEGKANQYFLRAFNLDHGTDLALSVDDMPINLPTHAHGQGYSDLNFLIPELTADLHYKKGPYYADEGDFATAGTARIDILNRAPASVTLGAGEDGFRRLLVVGSTDLSGGTLLAAAEGYHNDGPFVVPDEYNRRNAVLRYHIGDDRDFFTVTGMAYSGRWRSTDQVPLRAIAAGFIDRYGSMDPTDGGESTRASVSFTSVKRTESGQAQLSAFVIRYKLDLWSNFTYYLTDPLRGDQMLQHDDRVVYGLKGAKTWYTGLGAVEISNVLGVQARVDDIRDVAIYSTDQRQTIGVRQHAGVTESTGAVYAESRVEWTRKVVTTLGVRDDVFRFVVRDEMVGADGRCTLTTDPLGCNTASRRSSVVSPKVGIALGPWARTTFFLNAGEGYHSNDARGVTRSSENRDAVAATPLTRATSAEAGIATEPVSGWTMHVDAFMLKIRSELVFEGDAGVTAPSGATTRTGIEWGNTYQATPWLAADLNTAFTQARFDSRAPPDDLGCGGAAASYPCLHPPSITGRYIPNSPTNVIDAGLTATRASGWFGSLRARHFGEAPLVEDNSVRSPAYTTIDVQMGYRRPKWLAAIDIFNASNVRWNDITYYYASRLKSERSPQADYVAHPGVPRTIRARIQYEF